LLKQPTRHLLAIAIDIGDTGKIHAYFLARLLAVDVEPSPGYLADSRTRKLALELECRGVRSGLIADAQQATHR
jgi:hypothetical protein